MVIEKQRKNIFKAKQTKPKPKPKKIKPFEEYFQECINNKTIPADTPPYLKKALERALKEYQQGIKKEKSALENFAEKYVINGEPGVIPIDFFVNKSTQLKTFSEIIAILICVSRFTKPIFTFSRFLKLEVV